MLHGVDLFCGAGGSTTGLMMACEELGERIDVLAINHWNIAIATHMTNYPGFRHMCENLDSVNPKKAIPGGNLDILLAGPECTHHSNARGGRPMLDQSRSSAWHVVRWAEALYINTIIVENVMEFQKWGPLDRNGKRIREREGETYNAFITALESLDYRVEWRILNAADYGDATTRKRLFIIARRGKGKINWPSPTHCANAWRPARDVIDWSIPGQSIFRRKKPLAPATMARIMAGLKKFGGEKIEPFLIVFRNHQDVQSLDSPLPTMTTSGANFGLCEPVLLENYGTNEDSARAVESGSFEDRRGRAHLESAAYYESGKHDPNFPPKGGASDEERVSLRGHALARRTGGRSSSSTCVDTTYRSNTRGNGYKSYQREENREQSCEYGNNNTVSEPRTCIRNGTESSIGISRPSNNSEGDKRCGSSNAGRGSELFCDIREVWDQQNSGIQYLQSAFLIPYYRTGIPHSLDKPMDTITAKDRIGLVIPEMHGVALDIRFRMLQPHELSAAMGFPKTYKFAGTREAKVRQIGNAWSVRTAKALCKAVLQ